MLPKMSRGTNKAPIGTLVIKCRLGKMCALSRRKQETWLLMIEKADVLSGGFASIFTGK